ncbi:MAG TPA: hypothetical protein VNA25_01410 [Phycisphaerae bacterium]|nr:hypothetical protein [Phycisphaerae bacterium]
MKTHALPVRGLRAKTLAVAVLVGAALCSPAGARDAKADAEAAKAAGEFLTAAVNDPNTADIALLTLRMTGDADLLDLFVAYSAGKVKRYRALAATALSELKGDKAVAALLERARGDPEMAIRSQALALLIQMKAVSAEQLTEAIKTDNDDVRYLAASGLVSAGRGQLTTDALRLVTDTLQKLTESADASTAGLARLGLLSLGRTDQLKPIAAAMSEPNADPRVLTLMLTEIHEEKIAAAAALAEKIAASPQQSDNIRLHAYKALAAISPDGPGKLLQAIEKSDRTVFRVYLFRMLARRDDAQEYVKALAHKKDAIAALARFEMARAAADQTSTKAAAQAVAYGHPIVVGHVLETVQQDLPKLGPKADCYVPVLLDIVRNTPKQTRELRREQELSAWAAQLLGEIGTDKALTGLKKLLGQRHGEPLRATVAGMLKTANPAAVKLLKPLLDSPYDEICSTAALAMARKGDKDSIPVLGEVIAHAHRHRPSLVVLASWYTLKLLNQHQPVLKEIIKAVD